MKNFDALRNALDAESRKITEALDSIGYKVVKIDLEQILNASDNIMPDVKIWAAVKND